MEEDVVEDLKKELKGQIEETGDKKREEEEKINKQGEKQNLWKKIPTRYLGQKYQ